MKESTTHRRWLSAALLASLIFAQVFTLNLFGKIDRVLAGTLTNAPTAACPLGNGDFEAAAFAPWYLQVDGANGADATLSWDKGYDSAKSAYIQINRRGSDNWHVQLSQRGATLVAGRRYTFSFWARASQPRVVTAQLQQYGQPFVELWKQAFGLTEEWQLLETTFDYPANAITLAPVFRFDLAQTTGALWIDDVSLCESDSQPAMPTPIPVADSCEIANGDFETGQIEPWVLRNSSTAQATWRWDAGARSARSVRIDVAQAGSDIGAVTFEQPRIKIQPNTWLALGFHARASKARTLVLEMEDAVGKAVWRKTVRLVHPLSDANFRHHFFTFKTPNETANGAGRLRIQMGDSVGSVWLDALHLCAAKPQFADEFEGNGLDLNKWQHCKAYTENCAEMNYGVQSWYKPTNAQVSNGTLKMLTTKERNTVCIGCKFNVNKQVTRDYASVYIQTNGSFTPQYGFIEARMKMPSAYGLWPAFWLHPRIEPTGNVRWPPEIDTMEFYTNRPDRVWQTLHYNTSTQFNISHGQQYLFSDLMSDFHTYAVNWTPNEIIWYVDGAETFRSSRYKVREPMFLILDVEVGGPAGKPDTTMANGAITEVDYVRVFDNSRAFGFGDGAPVSNPQSTATPIPATPQATKAAPTPNPTTLPSATLRAWVQDGDLRSLARWRVQVFQGDRLFIERDSDGSGRVSFALPPDRYRVCEVVLPGWQNQTPGQSACYWLTLRAGDNTELVFENVRL